MTSGGDGAARSASMAVRPSVPGIRMSMRTTSGRQSCTAAGTRWRGLAMRTDKHAHSRKQDYSWGAIVLWTL